ncbi:tRNA (guanosine(46)-N7)-methyltransferase TrmB [Helicobacter aurati]|uniref:tRNA (guanine-N(7)-)-methyltransferase n=1 Tax=Helicobacter aurati TaxID=137778 RepID=A0A3D8J779_9HELI|nr:tRNA (guanosine(46)-N7)-methyltransferase TrmB [Helicobacter aurati]RDU73357.1 tRNA (guanosine(46)-N7)-methyltransferase TrmB [Helicobacter aurati]
MPHFVSSKKFMQTNVVYQDFQIADYLYNESFPNLSILPVIYQDEMIFIRCIQRQKDYLYKVDKLARIADIVKIKELLCFLSKDLGIITHNLNHTKKKHTRGFQTGFLIELANIRELQVDFIEIGFGSGRHILELAKNNPDKTILGFEIHLPSIRQVMNAIEIYNLNNLYICNVDARLGIQIIPTDTTQRIFLHFPVPWNKAKHRRVFNRDFLEHSFRILKSNGSINVRTDDLEYFQDCIHECLSANHTYIEIHKNNATEVISKYEQRWNAKQKDIYELNIFKQSLQFDRQDEIQNFHFPDAVEDFALFCNKKWIEKSFFVSIGDLYQSQSGHKISLAQLTFGSFYVPFNTYLIAEQQMLSYLKCPLNIRSHRLAHQFLCKILSQKIYAQRDVKG